MNESFPKYPLQFHQLPQGVHVTLVERHWSRLPRSHSGLLKLVTLPVMVEEEVNGTKTKAAVKLQDSFDCDTLLSD